jgi:photosystem II stability/assembly factor-like uncharacterized protein
MRFVTFFVFSTMVAHPVSAQWVIEQSPTAANLRGIHSLSGGIAWASGTEGTVLRTADYGVTWQQCAVPAGAEELDFRGIQAFNEKTAVVMSSGPGNQSRIYLTTDGCRTWELVFTNPDAPQGFFDAIQFEPGNNLFGDVLGDPVAGKFAMFRTQDGGRTWSKFRDYERASAKDGEVVFAASNSSLLEVRGRTFFVTGGSRSRSRTIEEHQKHDPFIFERFIGGNLPLARGASAGAFSVAAHLGPGAWYSVNASNDVVRPVTPDDVFVAVGGDYQRPEESIGTGAVSTDGSLNWLASETPPHGYRSSVAYDAASKTWVTVGPNGTDISTDDGRHWRPLEPSAGEPVGADKNWNALSLPFVVGPNGRIGKLRAGALAP